MSKLVVLMNRDTMLEKLEKGINPLDVTIEKWTLMVLWHKERDGNDRPDRSYYVSTTCPLCEVNTIYNESCDIIRCNKCLITKYGKPCGYNRSIWKMYNEHPSIVTARLMVELVEMIKMRESDE